MIHDELLDCLDSDPHAPDRRSELRRPASRDILISWHHQPDQTVRYPLVNEGVGGCLIRSVVPLISGLSGTLTGHLPPVTQTVRPTSVLVAWSRNRQGIWHVGLRFFAV